MQIPGNLKERLRKLGIDEAIYDMRSRKCILSRISMALENVPWYEHAFYISDNFDKKDEFIFDPISLAPCIALAPEKHDRILDMCAAPGTKTFILSFMTDNEAHITANDISRFRVKRLKSVVNKYGLSVEVLNKSGRKLEGEFDKILLDAPCSGEGIVNKSQKLFEHWSDKRIKRLSKIQKKLVSRAFELLADGGTLVYSTCTFGPEENEDVVDFLLKKNPNARLEEINTKGLNHSSGLTEFEGKKYSEGIRKTIRIYPFHNNTGGFFVAKIKKV